MTQLATGLVLGAYRLVRRLGAGGMGEVWLAEHAMLGRRAAIKVLHPAFSQRPDIVARFFNEARAATAISDPGIVQIFDFGHRDDGTAFIVMEMLDGQSLEDRLARGGPLPVVTAMRMMRQIAASLGAAHARGIVHRDLKPDNIFLVPDPEVAGGERTKLLDFGIAKLTGAGVGVKTQTSALLGTPTYMSPEQCRGAGQVDSPSDVYALGCVLFRAVTGRPPFDAEGAGEILAMHLREPAPRLSAAYGAPLGELDAIVARCLDKLPARRFSSGTALAAALSAALESLGELAAPARAWAPIAPPPTTPTTLSAAAAAVTGASAPARRRGWIAPGIAVIALAVAAVSLVRGRAPGEVPPVAAAAAAVSRRVSEVPAPPPPPVAARPAPPAVVAAPVPAPIAAPAPVPAPDPAAAPGPAPRRTRRDPARPACSAVTFMAVLNAPAPSADAVRSALVRLADCRGTMAAGDHTAIHRGLLAKLR